MIQEQATRKIVVVTGGVTMDWHLAHSQPPPEDSASWKPEEKTLTYNPEEKTLVCWEVGGAARLAQLIDHIAKRLGNCEVRQMDTPASQVAPTGAFFHSYALWSHFPPPKEAKNKEPEAWRVSQFLGVH
ncbi:MAG: hypothetical protein NTW80_10110 [Deltaproteobacteria bacterium]|nr:hypothetical protein [Deltaproteobacteria bacterium]